MKDKIKPKTPSRVSMTEKEKQVTATALRQYVSGRAGKENSIIAGRLINRLVDSTPGNPRWINPDIQSEKQFKQTGGKFTR